MSPVTMFTALIAGVIVWLLVASRLTTRSWENPGEAGTGGGLAMAPARIGLWTFMAVATSLFSLFLTAYLMRMHHGFWCHVDPPRILWLNTALLLIASAAFQDARRAVDRGRMGRVRSSLAVGGTMTIAFLAGQFLAWRELAPTMYFIQGSPATASFHLLTGVHGLHVLGGLWAWGRIVARLGGGAELVDVRLGVQLCTVYWHFLLVVWLVLFAALSTN